MPRLLPLVALAALAAGCDSRGPSATPDVTVVSRSLGRGAALEALAGATSEADLAARARLAYLDVLASDVPARAGAVAREIAAARPHVVAVQEAAVFRTQSPGDYAGDPAAVNATRVGLDALAVLLDSLAARGLDYRVAARAVATDVEVPMDGTRGRLDLRVTDTEAVLVRGDLPARALAERRFAAAGALPGHAPIPLHRAAAGAVVTVDGRDLTVASARLDARDAAELDAWAGTARPLVAGGSLGDALAGTDAWMAVRPAEPGATCCVALRAPEPAFATRPDRVVVRQGTVLDVVRVGAEAADRVRGVWPSDRAGLVARIRVGG